MPAEREPSGHKLVPLAPSLHRVGTSSSSSRRACTAEAMTTTPPPPPTTTTCRACTAQATTRTTTCKPLSRLPASSPAMSDTATIGLERKSIVEEFKELLRVEMESAKVILAAAVSYLTHSDSNDDDEYDDAGALMEVSAE